MRALLAPNPERMSQPFFGLFVLQWTRKIDDRERMISA
jgi:hypothetical protein